MNPYSEATRQRVFTLANQKHLTISAIALRVGVARKTVRNWLEPEVLADVRTRHAEATYHQDPEPSALDWDTATHADCEKVARWLETEHGKAFEAHRLRTRKSSIITVWALDEKLIHIGLHLTELPSDVWVRHGRERKLAA